VTEPPRFRAFCETGPCEWSSESEDSYNDADDAGSAHLSAAHPTNKEATYAVDET
jgi:hypothetical protein